MTSSSEFWRGGDRVEVQRLVSGATAYFPASVVNAPSVRKNLVWVEHEALMVGDSVRMKEYVTPTRLRPPPPRELNRSFKVGDGVDVFRVSEGCWVRGEVADIVGDSRYIVRFNGGNRVDAEVGQVNLRLHRDWVDGIWVPSILQQGSVKLKYEKAESVEVRSEEEGYKGSWYCARILSLVGEDKYIVEKLIFRKDECMSSGDLVEAKNMRPVPPPLLSPIVRYEPGDEVDAWFNKRWWTGRVSKVLEGGCKYLVYFVSTGEEPVVLNFNLRPHKDWINGQWVNQSKPPLKKKLKSCERVLFENGMLVEVRSDERGYEGSWFSAKIVSYLGENRYTVEYQTLRTDDETELLIEEARGSDIRPPPPPLIQKACGYELNDYVDAWFNEGWWSGLVCEINSDYTRYGVYFRTTGERLEFAYSDLRPCQVWIKGKWSRA